MVLEQALAWKNTEPDADTPACVVRMRPQEGPQPERTWERAGEAYGNMDIKVGFEERIGSLPARGHLSRLAQAFLNPPLAEAETSLIILKY